MGLRFATIFKLQQFSVFVRALSFAILYGCVIPNTLNASPSPLDSNDALVRPEGKSPPAPPPYGELAKWVSTPSMEFDTSAFKSYFYKGIPFRLLFPKSYRKNSKQRYPLLLFLHGGRELGNLHDNELQLFQGAEHFQKLVDTGSFDGFLLFPQASSGSGLFHDAHFQAIQALIEEQLIPYARVDRHRIIAHGISAGGVSTWRLALSHPELLAGAAPISATPFLALDRTTLEQAIQLPIWFFLGRQSTAPTAAEGRDLYATLKDVGANIRYSEYALLRHRCWARAWSEAEFIPWLNSVHQANPWPRFNRFSICTQKQKTAELIVTGGYPEYQWRKDGALISGATNNSLRIELPGSYSARIRSSLGWSEWSPTPAHIVDNCTEPEIEIIPNNPRSMIFPALDSDQNPTLYAPGGAAAYRWESQNSLNQVGSMRAFKPKSAGTYRVQIISDNSHESPQSDWLTLTDGAQSSPLRSSNILRARARSIREVELSWDSIAAAYPKASAIEIYRSDARPGKLSLVKRLPSEVRTFSDTPPQDTSPFTYLVSATLASGKSVSIIPRTNGGGSNLATYDLKWDASFIDEPIEEFLLFRAATQTSPYQLCTVLPAAARTFTDSLVSAGIRYSYRMRIAGASFVSNLSDPFEIAPTLDNLPPSEIKNLSRAADFGDSIRLKWKMSKDNSNELTYLVYVDGKEFRESGEPQILIPDLNPLVEHAVTIRARDNSGNASAPAGPFIIPPAERTMRLSYFEGGGSESRIPPLAKMTLLTQTTCNDFSLNARLSNRPAIYLWRMQLPIEEEGTRQFMMSCRGICQFFHAPYSDQARPESEIISEANTSRESTFAIDLKKGHNFISVLYYSRQEHPEFEIKWKEPHESEFKEFPPSP